MKSIVVLIALVAVPAIALEAQDSVAIVCQSAAAEKETDLSSAVDVSAFAYSTADAKYRITRDGGGTRTTAGARPQRFQLRLDDEDGIVKLYVCNTKDLLIVGVEVGSGGWLYRLDPQSLKTLWRSSLLSFKLSAPVLDSNAAFVSGMGFVAAVDLKTGKYRWEYDGLYKDGPFNSFEPAELRGEFVLFREPHQSDDAAITINRSTGEVVSPASVRKRVMHEGPSE